MVKRTIYVILLLGIGCTPFYPTIYLDKNFDYTKSPINYDGFYQLEKEYSSKKIEVIWFYRNGLIRRYCCSDSLINVESDAISFVKNSPNWHHSQNKNPVGWGIHKFQNDTLYITQYENPSNGRTVNPERVNYYGKIVPNQSIIMFPLPGKKKWSYPRKPFSLNFYETSDKPDSTNAIITIYEQN